MDTVFYLFPRRNGVDVPAATRGPNSRAVQVPVRVAEALHWRAHYLTKHLTTIAHFASQRFRIQAGEPRVSNGVRPDLHSRSEISRTPSASRSLNRILGPPRWPQVFSSPNMPATTNSVAEKPSVSSVGRAVLKKSSYPSSNVNPTRPLASPVFIARHNSHSDPSQFMPLEVEHLSFEPFGRSAQRVMIALSANGMVH